MEDLTGRQFGQYQIVAPLGEGGMAAVYKAYQPAMERFVAVKVLPRHMASSDEFVSRFRREAKLLAQLQHPHILPVFDYGEADGHPYIVMPFVHSGTLAELLHKRRLSLSEVRRLMTQIGEALNYAHARGMIHRDIKPSNVLIDELGNCLLTDFGLARMAEAATKITTSGTVMGTPAYMSPEQGAGSNVDQRSDIYSLGIILYEMVTGRVPYTAETPVAVVFKHIQDPLPSARKFNPDLSEAIESVLLKVLAKNPEDRYQTADALTRAVQRAIPEIAMDDEVQTPPAASAETILSQPYSDIKSTETVMPSSTAQATKTEAMLTEIATTDTYQQPAPSSIKSKPISAGTPRRRIWRTVLILVLIGFVFAFAISLAKSYKVLVTDPASYSESYNISNLRISTSADSYYATSTFSKDQDVYVSFDLNYVQTGTPFRSRWYYQVNILGKDVYFLTTTLIYISEAGDKNIYFHLNKPAVKGYYRVDIYMNDSLVNTQYFSVQ
jgi:serine/threonine protein kinase